ncbi:unnamed protein product [Arctia plantaginis]|nr:unnamed protein product [Arctia plantaginis]
MVSEDVNGFPLTGPGNYSCVNQLPNGNFTFATNCTNGRGLIGCCVDRPHCIYNTSNIDLTMYAPPGFKG